MVAFKKHEDYVLSLYCLQTGCRNFCLNYVSQMLLKLLTIIPFLCCGTSKQRKQTLEKPLKF